METTYTIPQPKLSPVAWGLAALLVAGLIGLGTAAYMAFILTALWWQALAFAVVIELGAIIEAQAIIKRNWFAIPGLIVSIVVSLVYNYQQAAQAAALLAHPLGNLELIALAVGPLSATFFVALSFGAELQHHEKRVQEWQAARQKWHDHQAELAAKREERKAVKLAEIEARNVPGNTTGTGANVLPLVLPPKGTYQEYAAFMRANGANHTRAELAAKFNVTERAITKWAAKYREEHPAPTPELQVN